MYVSFACLCTAQADGGISFDSSDPALVKTFDWAKRTALSYVHNGSDPVGLWYEAALPGRNAFCMRDASHQSIPAAMLGLSGHNLNMMCKFAENISEPKDYCTHWEIDKDNRPCPADYVDDANFWYNLNANFDVMFACWRLYEWTGDERYLNHPSLAAFYRLSADEYVERWQLEPDLVMTRTQRMNNKPGTEGRYQEVRGLPSYVENYPGLTASSDLIAALYGGFNAYGRMMGVKGDMEKAALYKEKAEAYRSLLESMWWNPSINAYHTFWTGATFADGEGLTYMLWFDAVQDPARIRGTVAKMKERKNWNAENISHFPLLGYRYGEPGIAYSILSGASQMHRKEYPEVSYGMIEGIVGGLMGIQPSASAGKVTTLPQLPADSEWAEAKDVPMLKGCVSIRHEGNAKTCFTNNTPEELMWEAAFQGKGVIEVDGKPGQAYIRTDRLGNMVSYIEVRVAPGETVQAVFCK